MAFEGYDAFDDPYLYKNTPILKNRLGIRDPGTLAAFEVEMSSLRADEPLPSGRFDAVHYRTDTSSRTSTVGQADTELSELRREAIPSVFRSISIGR